jgi:hypothetical protein
MVEFPAAVAPLAPISALAETDRVLAEMTVAVGYGLSEPSIAAVRDVLIFTFEFFTFFPARGIGFP